MAKDKTLPAVPESILKKRKRVNEAKAQALKAKNLTKLEKQEKRTQYFKRAEKYVQEYLAAEAEENRLKLEAKKAGNFYVPGEPKLAFVVRIRGINQIAPKPRKVMQLFRLRQINNGVFIKLNKATTNMLRICGKCGPYSGRGCDLVGLFNQHWSCLDAEKLSAALPVQSCRSATACAA